MVGCYLVRALDTASERNTYTMKSKFKETATKVGGVSKALRLAFKACRIKSGHKLEDASKKQQEQVSAQNIDSP